MQVYTEEIKKQILKMGFTPQNGKNNIYLKTYSLHNGYEICVDFNTKRIAYYTQSAPKDVRITIGEGTICNFSRAENFVVLECVNRLLEKGYTPSCIELEKIYPSGRGHSGRLDVLVNTVDGKAFLMIECKTWGKEYEKERKKMLADGGQLFTYYKNAVAARHLCLYSSHFAEDKIEYVNSIIDIQEEWTALSEVKDVYEHWNKTFKSNGIFEIYSLPYNIVHKRLTYGDLENMHEDDSGKIYNQIMEILRHNGISDKPNAFNKLLNLFVCKIIDEDKNENDELEFQCWDGLTDEKLQMTLNDLYKEGMWRFLNIEVIDHSMEEVVEKLDGMTNASHKSALIEIISDLRLKKSPNFAFIEVLDDKTFRLNAKVVREIVELLQGYRFRYEQKHEFLGNFFEMLLNTSMKQEAGQFFTPVPITKFIISSLPLKDFVQKQIDNKSNDPLPTVIDYACGSGHFLTEFMEQLQGVIECVDIKNASPSIKKRFASWRDNVKFSWAQEYVYGIDFDNRLVKTTKVSAFFNGDGEANVIWGNGLDNFARSADFRGKLKRTLHDNDKDNGQFDILISNPPYSVQSFRRTLKDGADTFELYHGLTDNSSEIECLFVERTKQLLKIGGWAGVVLPSSILSNGGIYARARDIIFRYFNVKAIVELGSGTFMKTGTNTVILFLERRADNEQEKIAQAIDTFFADKKDVTVWGMECAFSKFTANVYEDLSFEDYVSFVNKNPTEAMKNHDLWKDYIRDYGENIYAKAFEIERQKMFYFLMTYNQKIVLARSGQKQDEKNFLGYEFKERRGQEGIHRLPNGTMLFDESGDISNRQKVNSYIYNAFLNTVPSEIDSAISKYVSYGHMSGFIEYGTSKFNIRVNLNKKIKFTSSFPLIRLGDCVEVGGGLWTGIKQPLQKVRVIRGADFTFDGKLDYEHIAEIEVEVQAYKLRKLYSGDIILEKSGGSATQAVGRVALFDKKEGEYAFSNFTARLQVTNEKIMQKYLFYVLHQFYVIGGTYPLQKDGKSQLKNLDMKAYLETKIPVPPMEIQQKIVTECEKVQKEIEQTAEELMKIHETVQIKFVELFGDPVTNPMGWETKALGDLGTLKNGMNYKKCDKGYLIKCLGVGDFGNLYKITGTDSLSEISLSAEPSEEYLLKDGDVVFVRSNGNATLVGRSIEVFPHNHKVTYSGFCIRYRNVSDRLLTVYLNHALHLPSMRRELVNDGKGTNIKNLNQQILSSLKIPLPPMTIQERFSDFVRDMEQEKENLQQLLDSLNKKYRDVLENICN